MKAYLLLPMIFIALYIFVAVSIFVINMRPPLIPLEVVTAFITIYFIAKAGQEKQPSPTKNNFDQNE